MKKTIYFVIATIANTLIAENSQSPSTINQSIEKIINFSNTDSKNIDQDIIEQTINELKKENAKLEASIIQLKINLAQMRVNQGGKGTIKPAFAQAAQKIIESIKSKSQTIYKNKVQIQLLELTSPNLKLTPVIKKKQIIQTIAAKAQATPESKKKK